MSDRRQNFDFYEMGIKAGEELTAVRDSTIKAHIKDERQVTYKNKDYYLTALNDELGFTGNTCKSWLYNGKSLEDIFDETYPKEGKDKAEKENKLKRYFVISPNVKNDTNTNKYLEEMIETKSVLMGWGPKDPKGKKFSEMEIGDRVIIAQGANWQKKAFFIGTVKTKSKAIKSSKTGETVYCRKLEDFVNVQDCNDFPFTTDCSYGNANRVSAIYELKTSNPADMEVINRINHLITRSSMNTNIEEYISLLKSNHNIILHGAPGTGKTHLAKKIAKAMGCTDDEIGFVQFHPSYDYTDFVEGLRPINSADGNNIGFERRDGVFKEFCAIAAKNFADSKKSDNELDIEQKTSLLLDSFLEYLEDKLQNGPVNFYGCYDIINLRRYSDEQIVSIQFKSKTAQNIRGLQKEKILEDYPNYLNGKIQSLHDVPGGGVVVKHHAFAKQYFAFFELLKSFEENEYRKQSQSSCPISSIPKKPFVFIIDEINRGEMSKIFGELFFSIDPGYRGFDENGKPKGLVQTQYQNLVDGGEFVKGFYVPENVYIIGTMNDIDRSVESMDFAMRRRFIFKEITAEESAVNMGLSENVKLRMTNLNKAISSIEGLNSSYHIGGAYFLKEVEIDGEMKRMSVESEDFDNLWELKLEPLLKEYLRGMEDTDEKLKELKDAYKNDDADESED